MRVTDALTLQFVKETLGRVHFEIEALLSMGLSKPPIANSAIRIANGNFITARPIGVVDGIDLMYTGEVRKRLMRQLFAHVWSKAKCRYFHL